MDNLNRRVHKYIEFSNEEYPAYALRYSPKFLLTSAIVLLCSHLLHYERNFTNMRKDFFVFRGSAWNACVEAFPV